MKKKEISEQAEAWMAVCSTLYEVMPGWCNYPGNGIESAVAAIRALAEQARVVGEPVAPTERTGNVEVDTVLDRLNSSDPDFDDCAAAAALIYKLEIAHRGPAGFATWKEAAMHERMQRLASPPAPQEAQPLASSDPEGHRQAIADHEAEQAEAPSEIEAKELWDCLCRLTNLRIGHHVMSAADRPDADQWLCIQFNSFVEAEGMRKALKNWHEAARAKFKPDATQPTASNAGEREIKPDELTIETWPPSPKTGMIVGMSKGVKITHNPTGISVTCDSERSQHLNRDKAWEQLRAALASKPAEPVAPPARGRDFHAAKAAWIAEPEWNNPLQAYDRGWYDCSVLSATPPAQAVQDSQAVRDVLTERERQKSVEGWTPEHDDEHGTASMAAAAGCYAFSAASEYAENTHWSNKRFDAAEQLWPWDREWWKPSTPRRDLVKAGALILAEIERLDRAARARGEVKP